MVLLGLICTVAVTTTAILAGGGFRHDRHLAFDTDNNSPLSNLYVTILQRLGMDIETFASSTGTLRGLDGGG